MPVDGDSINELKMLIDIKGDISSIKTQVSALTKAPERAQEALTLAKENEKEIANIKRIVYWFIGLVVSGVGVSLLVYITEHLI